MFGLDGGHFIFLLFLLLPFILNASLAKSRGKSVALMLLLTVVFSWIVTLVLAFMPKVYGKK
jgi:hypothetical protein